jgi:hypothetical protein
MYSPNQKELLMPKFVRKDVVINPDAGPISIQVLCGFAHHIRFVCELFDRAGNNPRRIHVGSSLETDPPPFTIDLSAQELLGTFAMITADVFNLGISNNFNVDMVFRQGGNEIDRITVADIFTDNVAVSLVGRFQ